MIKKLVMSLISLCENWVFKYDCVFNLFWLKFHDFFFLFLKFIPLVFFFWNLGQEVLIRFKVEFWINIFDKYLIIHFLVNFLLILLNVLDRICYFFRNAHRSFPTLMLLEFIRSNNWIDLVSHEPFHVFLSFNLSNPFDNFWFFHFLSIELISRQWVKIIFLFFFWFLLRLLLIFLLNFLFYLGR